MHACLTLELFRMLFSNKWNQGFLEKWIVLELRWEVEKRAQDICGGWNMQCSQTNEQTITSWRESGCQV